MAVPIANRPPADYPILRIVVVHGSGGGVTVTDPNGAAMLGLTDWAKGLKPLPNTVSALSARPAVLYTSSDMVVSLAPDELHRLLRLDLQPEEALTLLTLFDDGGRVPHEIHDDFYDPLTGEALQPR